MVAPSASLSAKTAATLAGKRDLRTDCRTRRAAHPDARSAAAAAAGHFRDAFFFGAGTVIAGYWPIRDELDCLPLLGALARDGATIALPVVSGRRAPLAFRAWDVGRGPPPLDEQGIPTPPVQAPRVRPVLLVVPLLAFDAKGWRLGYGGGYYDRTIATFRASGGVTAVGYAFTLQEVPAVPHLSTDQRLDAVVTENGIVRFGA
jgi:5-formyltetrahydrofolate cyclo-ligase